MTDTIELLPCPFCGGGAAFAGVAHRKPYAHYVYCKKCKAQSYGSAFSNDEFNAKEWNARYAPRWISVEDRLPEDGQRVLTWIGEPLACKEGCEAQIGTAWLSRPDDEYACAAVTFTYDKAGFLGGNEVTHWMPLPQLIATKEVQ